MKDGPLSVYRPFTAYSSSGPIGDLKLASADKGERLFDQLCDALAEILQETHEQMTAET